MIQVLGISENVTLEIREKLNISQKHIGEKLEALLEICQEALILSTCNRIEIYFNCSREDIINELFRVLQWDRSYREHFFYLKSRQAIEHLMEVSCGFHSKVLGEEQILGQIKDAFGTAVNFGAVNKELYRLFQTAVACGKEFRHKSELYKIPVSSSSIAASIAREKGAKSYMILGFGEVGELTLKYLLACQPSSIYIAVRNMEHIAVRHSCVKIIPFSDRKSCYGQVDCIISCTSAPHPVIRREDLPDKELLIFDLAVPRDVHSDVFQIKKVQVFDIDSIGIIDNDNRKKREEVMFKNRNLVRKHADEFISWLDERELSCCISAIKQYGENVYKQRYKVFKNKKHTKDNDQLAETLLKSTSTAFVNRAIEVLKEERQKGSVEECMRIIGKMFGN